MSNQLRRARGKGWADKERERKLPGGIGKLEYSSFVPNSLARVPRKIKGLMNAPPSQTETCELPQL